MRVGDIEAHIHRFIAIDTSGAIGRANIQPRDNISHASGLNRAAKKLAGALAHAHRPHGRDHARIDRTIDAAIEFDTCIHTALIARTGFGPIDAPRCVNSAFAVLCSDLREADAGLTAEDRPDQAHIRECYRLRERARHRDTRSRERNIKGRRLVGRSAHDARDITHTHFAVDACAVTCEGDFVDDEFVGFDIVAPAQTAAVEIERAAAHRRRAAPEFDIAVELIDADLAVEANRNARRHWRIQSSERA